MSVNKLVMTSGDTRTFTVTITDAAGDPYDLTDADVAFSVSDPISITKTVGDGITVADPETGIAVVTIDPDDTDDLEDRMSCRYDVQVTLSSGAVVTPLRGLFVVTPGVTE